MTDRSWPRTVDAERFASEAQLQAWCARVGGEGYRGTGSAAHERVLAWIEAELHATPGIEVRQEEFEVLRWQPEPEGDLEHAGSLWVDGVEVPIGGAVPYTAPEQRSGPLVHLPPGTSITAEAASGRIVLRDFPEIPLPYDGLLGLGFHATPGCDALRGETWDRPGLADSLLHADLLAAGEAGAAGVVFAFDLPREQIAGYYEPHKGTHYRVPGVFVGVDERDRLRLLAAEQASAEVAVRAEVATVTTRNLYATLPGRSPERIVALSHTDGNTWVQENGSAALLALARYFAEVPAEQRPRTLELAFTSAHLHISREGAARYAHQLDAAYDDGTVAFAFPIEHLGARELVPVPRTDGPGRRLAFTDGEELVLWCVGPSDVLRDAVLEAIERRGLDRVLVAPGLGEAVDGQVPRIVSFGGLGTYPHLHLVPTTSIITGPWSLWAPAFGRDAIDVAVLRRQVLAAGDVIASLAEAPIEAIAGGYLADRAARTAGAPVGVEASPPEVAPG